MGCHRSESPRSGKGNPHPRRLEIKNKIIRDFFAKFIRSVFCCPVKAAAEPGDGASPGAPSPYGSSPK
ncbi:unnamed protein product [Spirodela intermedia]|uniref:Uncharacterized protein n=1 Tax=Spirodela intermedia TaxID=51605 RepID=A0A7I8IAR0_SPIIN|nr:unnamed protein product [Spirodela intermedia]CAA6654816.1 unnamed protein product [Spirodela intermedia]